MSQREILFKAKRTDNGEWIEGYLWSKRTIGYTSPVGNTDEIVVDPETVCQYTGLTDKNGKKIFDGDIVDCKTTLYYMHEFEVSWDVETASWIIKNPLNKYKMDSSFEYKVIGNINDN